MKTVINLHPSSLIHEQAQSEESYASSHNESVVTNSSKMCSTSDINDLSQTITTLQNDSLSSIMAPIFQTTPSSQSMKCRKWLTPTKSKCSYTFYQFLNLKCNKDTKKKFKTYHNALASKVCQT